MEQQIRRSSAAPPPPPAPATSGMLSGEEAAAAFGAGSTSAIPAALGSAKLAGAATAKVETGRPEAALTRVATFASTEAQSEGEPSVAVAASSTLCCGDLPRLALKVMVTPAVPALSDVISCRRRV